MENVFGTDGIRCVANDKYLTVDFLSKLVPAIVDRFRPKCVVVCHDSRISGGMLSHLVAALFSSYGVHVSLADVMPTPAIAYVTKTGGFDLGIMISASHNPYQDNGIKIFNKNGQKLSKAEEVAISELIDRNTMKLATHNGVGSIVYDADLLESYKKYIVEQYKQLKSIKRTIVIDCANGSMSAVAEDIMHRIGLNVTVINNTPNGININDNCGAVYPNRVAIEVIKSNADIGFAFDGDGDRLIVCDEKGNPVDGDHIIGFLATNIEGVNNVAITEMSNIGLDIHLRTLGIATLRTHVGDKFITKEIISGNADFGGEKSGHIVFNNDVCTGDGLVSALNILDCLRETNKPVSESVRMFKLTPSVSENIKVQDRELITEDILHKIRSSVQCADDMRVLIRKSGTENIIRVLVEGEDEDLIATTIEKIRVEIRKYV